MATRAPSRGKIAIMVVFALSCFAILLYIWKGFGGPSPLAAQKYKLNADFAEAVQLSDTAQVRISGVQVGRVSKTLLTGGRTRATMLIDPRYAPLPRDTRAILRQKTLLGETYIELAPGSRRSGTLPDGATLPRRQIASTVELDEVLRALDPRTRGDLQKVVAELSAAAGTRGQSLNDTLGNLHPFVQDTNDMLSLLDTQHAAVRRLVNDSGVVLTAASRRQGDISGLIRAADRLLATTARRDRDIVQTVQILPTTLAESKPTLERLDELAHHATPVVRALRPAARALGPTLVDTTALAPDLEALLRSVDRLTTVSRIGLPAATRIVNAAHPVFRILTPTLQQALPIVQFLALYKRDIPTATSNLAASNEATQTSVAGGPPIHYLRALVPGSEESLVAFDKRLSSNRHNPYFRPLGLRDLPHGLKAFDCSNANGTPGQPAPPCVVQTPLHFQGRQTAYPRVQRGR